MTDMNEMSNLERAVRAFQGMAMQDPTLVRKHEERLKELADDINKLIEKERKRN